MPDSGEVQGLNPDKGIERNIPKPVEKLPVVDQTGTQKAIDELTRTNPDNPRQDLENLANTLIYNRPKSEGVYVGVKRNPDGTLDYSKAARFSPEDEDKYIAESEEIRQKQEQEKAQRRKEIVGVPDGIPPGTYGMVDHNIKKQLFLEQERADLAKEKGDPVDEGAAKRIRKLELEKKMMDMVSGTMLNRIVDESENRNVPYPTEKDRTKVRMVSAQDTQDIVRHQFSTKFMDLKADGKTSYRLGQQEYTIDELIETSRALEGRLNSAANSTPPDSPDVVFLKPLPDTGNNRAEQRPGSRESSQKTPAPETTTQQASPEKSPPQSTTNTGKGETQPPKPEGVSAQEALRRRAEELAKQTREIGKGQLHGHVSTIDTNVSVGIYAGRGFSKGKDIVGDSKTYQQFNRDQIGNWADDRAYIYNAGFEPFDHQDRQLWIAGSKVTQDEQRISYTMYTNYPPDTRTGSEVTLNLVLPNSLANEINTIVRANPDFADEYFRSLFPGIVGPDGNTRIQRAPATELLFLDRRTDRLNTKGEVKKFQKPIEY